ncbi:STAS domain-containing protein [Georgenia yuyongxinii]|uniref:STAS domain-containing protein n=1 Tax=Georgenia yuyongxinii TaxID=2589797 RepID=A0A5B8C510_9MICO|nr:STAS domain-containing protein [Georgenia yuyongxinii]QDC25408.1 STAS domain-containing protein [Georgenia yuyongxinii]
MAAHSPLPEPEPGTVALFALEDRVRLVLSGELDLATKADLLRAVREAVRYDQPVEVDTRHVTFMDSSAITTLSRLTQHTDQRPIFISPSDVVRFLLDVTMIGELVDVVDHDGALPAATAVHQASVTTSA